MNKNIHETDFLTFILSMISSTLVQLGDLPNPTTNTLNTVDLSSAKYSIDTLTLLREKTAGNLTPEEEEAFTKLLCDVQMRYTTKAQKIS